MDWHGLRIPQETPFRRGIAQGTVSGTKTVTVRFAGTDITCRALRDITTAAGDIVLAVREGSELVVVGRLHAAAPSAPDAEATGITAPEGTSRSGSLVVKPVETRSYRSGGWRNDMDDLLQSEWGGDLYTGCAFYGTAPRSLAGTTITGITVKMKRVAGGSSDPRSPDLYRITESTKPSGAPTRTGSAMSGPELSVNETDTFTLPTSFGTDLVAGTCGGLGIWVASDSDPHVRLAGRSKWSSSMVLTLSWTRVS